MATVYLCCNSNIILFTKLFMHSQMMEALLKTPCVLTRLTSSGYIIRDNQSKSDGHQQEI